MGKKAALLSVSDRSGLSEFAKVLKALGYELLATSGTTKALNEAGIETTPIERYTGQKEILDGRVKTLHPKIHAGLLAKREDPAHLAQLEEEGILPIDVAVVNLYPFTQNLHSLRSASPDRMIELIDIGGPTMIRAAAKNFKYVVPVIDPADYPQVARLLSAELGATEALELRRSLATKVFTQLAHYNLEIARYLAHVSLSQDSQDKVDSSLDFLLGEVNGMVLTRVQELRYGENPHQRAAFYRSVGSATPQSWAQLNGKELSYNNLLDFDAALKLIRALGDAQPAAAIIKHLNPCGAARGSSLIESLHRAKRGDPRSHFGGIIALNRDVTLDVAREIRGDFAEIVLAPGYAPEALAALRENKNLRVIQVPTAGNQRGIELRAVEGGILIQESDRGTASASDARVVSRRAPTESELRDLDFAWTVCSHVKSNAIVLVKDQTVIGVGAGQMSRIDSVELALSKARTHEHTVRGAVAASDAFFPFPDSVQTLVSAGITAIISPGGAKRDEETVAAADAGAAALLMSDERHFRH